MTREDIDAIAAYIDARVEELAETIARPNDFRTTVRDEEGNWDYPAHIALRKLRARARPITSQSPIIPD